MSIKLIAIDIDGTLAHSNHQVSEKNINALQAAHQKGLKIVLASGRPFLGVQPILKQLDFKDDHFAISNNGALVHDGQDGAVVHEALMNHDDYQHFLTFAQQQDLPFHAISENKIYTSNKAISPYTVHESYLTNTPLFYIEQHEIDPNWRFSKIMLCDDKTKLDEAQKQLPKALLDEFNVYRSTDFFIECLNKKASKGLAVQYVAQQYGFLPKEIMVIGDQYNDLSMFEIAGCKVAMGNAIEALKAQATFVTKTNNEDGVAYAIEKLILNPA